MRQRLAMLLFIVVASAGTAEAADTYEVTITQTETIVSTGTDYPNLLQIVVKKNGTAVPNDTDVVVRRLSGDARLYKGSDSITNDKQITIKTAGGGGLAQASVLMRNDPKLKLLISVPNAADAANPFKEETFDIDSTVGAVEDCSKSALQDCREDTELSFYTGYAINTFAAPELSGGKNGTSQDVIGGFDFYHRVWKNHHGDLWVYGETLHGIRSSNNCDGTNQDGQDCKTFAPDGTQLTGVLKGASTIEAYMGLQWEPPLASPAESGSRLYLKGQVGFISFVGRGADLIDNHHVGLGITKVHGPFTDSYVEVGYGRNDLFKIGNNGRWKFDGLISYDMSWPRRSMIKPFVQITADTDFGRFGDSVQTFIGFDFDLSQLKLKLGQ